MKNRNKWNGLIRAAKILFFALMMTVMCVIGMLWFLRPETSTVEKRKLTEFPKLSWAAFWDGSYFAGIETWYADTYPMRESLIAGNQTVENWYGIRSDQIIGETQVADEIPDPTKKPEKTEKPEETPEVEPEQPVEPEVPEEEPEEELEDGTVTDIGEMAGTIYITDNTGYGVYYFNQASADAYIEAMNGIYSRVKDKVNLYTLVAPIGSTARLDEAVLADMGCSDESKAIEYVYAQLDPGIHTVSVSENLKKHNSEYIYFATDHHWTQLGAYYAYQEFCKEKGIDYHKLDEFETMDFTNFLGTYYTSSNQSPELAANPDTVHAYIPNGTNEMVMDMADGVRYNWKVVNDVSDYDNTQLYAAYAGGDQPFAVAHNETITDGSAIMVIKDSYGNAFIPWLIDHYEYVYWVDFRYTTNTVSQMVEDYGVQDVLYLCNIYNMTGAPVSTAFARIGS